MQISVTTPALLFPAISLFMLAFTNRFLSLGARIRALHDMHRGEWDESTRKQIENLRVRVHMIRRMQGYGVLSMLTCIVSMVCLFQEWELAGAVLFGLSLLFLVISLLISFLEIRISVHALDILLEDMER
jgi:Zn-dependent membrane protease YugP